MSCLSVCTVAHGVYTWSRTTKYPHMCYIIITDCFSTHYKYTVHTPCQAEGPAKAFSPNHNTFEQLPPPHSPLVLPPDSPIGLRPLGIWQGLLEATRGAHLHAPRLMWPETRRRSFVPLPLSSSSAPVHQVKTPIWSHLGELPDNMIQTAPEQQGIPNKQR